MPDQSSFSPEQMQENFDDFFETSLCGFITADSKGFILRANATLAGWVNCSKKELIQKRLSDLLTIGGKIYFETHLWPLLRMQGFFEEVVLELNNNNEQKLRVMINALERKNDKGELQFIRFTIIKASDRLKYELTIQEAKKYAEAELQKQIEMVSLREQLIAVLGHDLRNPLSAVTMVAKLLEASSGQNNSRLINTLKRSCQRMSEIVMNIMDFARTRLGKEIVLAVEEVQLEPLIKQLVAEMQLIYPHRQIKISIDLIRPVHCDPHRIAQLVSNLLANALTHGDINSPIYIQSFEKSGELEISVTNKGIPIAEDIREHLFTPYTRESSRPSQHGLGLGLYICTKIAQAHRGCLNFISDESKTTFTFTMNPNALLSQHSS